MNRSGILKSLCRTLQPCKTRNISLSSKLKKDKLDAVLDAKLMSKRELIARQIENDNPFDTYTIKPDAATGIREKYPILIPATENSRMVGCLCEYDFEEVVWFKLDKGKVSQCECGYYFKLIEHDPLDMGVSPKFGKGQGSGMKAIV